ncbi:MAG: AtpZ/AtpI family protein [Candidatus Cloacimonetes bacterium]|jgi:ATP synthase protein I|nr:AtpZ/AtpI family protein [Candidatus Cloacimonadota bacterium]MBT4332265.1 AtpZ/AtpI family protein [Candidatus Cloacimonadota bacterium]MBT5420593.1 AtpZ/AtpI family protein [Candidatus Cloacimonadota bacterium]
MWKRKNPLNSELIKYISLISQLGFTIIGSILLFLAGAIFLERKFQTEGILILVGVLIGVISGVFAAYKLLKKTLEKE